MSCDDTSVNGIPVRVVQHIPKPVWRTLYSGEEITGSSMEEIVAKIAALEASRSRGYRLKRWVRRYTKRVRGAWLVLTGREEIDW